MRYGLLLLFILISCKTQEEINREKMVDNLFRRMKDNQKIVAESTSKIQNMEERLSDLLGQIQQLDYKSETQFLDEINKLKKRMTHMEDQQSSLGKNFKKLKTRMSTQEDYIQNVVKTLKSLQQKKNQNDYQRGLKLYRSARYERAKTYLLRAYNNSKYTGKTKAHITHNLAMIAYMDKEFDKALVYFSKLYSNYPKVIYNKNGLLFMAKTFLEKGQKSEAKQTLNELMKNFPDAKQVSEAKKMLKRL